MDCLYALSLSPPLSLPLSLFYLIPPTLQLQLLSRRFCSPGFLNTWVHVPQKPFFCEAVADAPHKISAQNTVHRIFFVDLPAERCVCPLSRCGLSPLDEVNYLRASPTFSDSVFVTIILIYIYLCCCRVVSFSAHHNNNTVWGTCHT